MSEARSRPPEDSALAAKLTRQFRHVRKFRDDLRDTLVAQILPGEYYVTAADELIATVLGSCISACIRDTRVGVGGMNHFMLPSGNAGDSHLPTRYGIQAMECLINDILQHGGTRETLEVKIFGGGRISPDMKDIGAQNIAFTREFLETEKIHIISEDVGLIYPRKVNYLVRTGEVMVKKLRSLHTQSIAEQEVQYSTELNNEPSSNVELFG